MRFAATRLTQRDDVSCGPAVAVVAGAMVDATYGASLTGQDWFDDEQMRVHAAINRLWPRRYGTTPMGVATAIGGHGVRYRWRPCRGLWGGRDRLVDVLAAVDAGWPVAMLVGRFVPRHWVLMVSRDRLRAPGVVQCYEPSSGEVRPVEIEAIRTGTLVDVGFARPYAFVLPRDSDRRHSNI